MISRYNNKRFLTNLLATICTTSLLLAAEGVQASAAKNALAKIRGVIGDGEELHEKYKIPMRVYEEIKEETEWEDDPRESKLQGIQKYKAEQAEIKIRETEANTKMLQEAGIRKKAADKDAMLARAAKEAQRLIDDPAYAARVAKTKERMATAAAGAKSEKRSLSDLLAASKLNAVDEKDKAYREGLIAEEKKNGKTLDDIFANAVSADGKINVATTPITTNSKDYTALNAGVNSTLDADSSVPAKAAPKVKLLPYQKTAQLKEDLNRMTPGLNSLLGQHPDNLALKKIAEILRTSYKVAIKPVDIQAKIVEQVDAQDSMSFAEKKASLQNNVHFKSREEVEKIQKEQEENTKKAAETARIEQKKLAQVTNAIPFQAATIVVPNVKIPPPPPPTPPGGMKTTKKYQRGAKIDTGAQSTADKASSIKTNMAEAGEAGKAAQNVMSAIQDKLKNGTAFNATPVVVTQLTSEQIAERKRIADERAEQRKQLEAEQKAKEAKEAKKLVKALAVILNELGKEPTTPEEFALLLAKIEEIDSQKGLKKAVENSPKITNPPSEGNSPKITNHPSEPSISGTEASKRNTTKASELSEASDSNSNSLEDSSLSSGSPQVGSSLASKVSDSSSENPDSISLEPQTEAIEKQKLAEEERVAQKLVQEEEVKQAVIQQTVDKILLNPNDPVAAVQSLQAADINMSAEFGISERKVAAIAGDDSAVGKMTAAEAAKLFTAALATMDKEGLTEAQALMNTIAQLPVARSINDLNAGSISGRIGISSGDGDGDGVGAGKSSGDEENTIFRGTWFTALYGTSKQGAMKNLAGYDGKTIGGTIGFDFGPNEDTIVGIAYSNVDTNFKFNGLQSGDKASARSHVFSIYGKTDLSNELIVNGLVAMNNTLVKSSSKRLIANHHYQNATGSFKTRGVHAEANLAYKIYAKEGFAILPTIGLRYTNQHDGTYSESGVGVQNLTVAAKKVQNLFGIVGTKLSFAKKLSNDLELVPSLNLSVENNITAKHEKIKTKLRWADQSTEQEIDTGKPAKLGYNVGASLLARHNNLELIGSYDLYMKKKYKSHQGTLKLKLAF